ncbi:MAG TPA: metallophosphoesterase [Longimicrobium sp.]|nr:metallophosphoesterase [Longimicrobium sp.]
MKLHVISDLHAGFAPFDLPQTDADVLVLAGDADVGLRGMRMAHEWARERPVVYVAGNHEFYGESIPRHIHKLRDAARGTPVRFLEDEAAVIGRVRFLGCTLWTDFDLFGDRVRSAQAAKAVMNDFRSIRVDPQYRRFDPTDAMGLHSRSLRWLLARLDEPFDGPTVVVTHCAPTLHSVSPVHRHDPVTAAYASNLEPLLDGRAALWIHGHTHYSCDYTVCGTRVIANQRGYPHETTGFDPAYTIEVPGSSPP